MFVSFLGIHFQGVGDSLLLLICCCLDSNLLSVQICSCAWMLWLGFLFCLFSSYFAIPMFCFFGSVLLICGFLLKLGLLSSVCSVVFLFGLFVLWLVLCLS